MDKNSYKINARYPYNLNSGALFLLASSFVLLLFDDTEKQKIDLNNLILILLFAFFSYKLFAIKIIYNDYFKLFNQYNSLSNSQRFEILYSQFIDIIFIITFFTIDYDKIHLVSIVVICLLSVTIVLRLIIYIL